MADDTLTDVADIHSIAGDGQSLGEKAADWVTKGIPVALASGVTSIMNTGISLGNMFGDFEKISTEDTIRGYDDNLADYYTAHREGADLGGFLATSLVPGTLGIKGLKALQAIRGGGAIGEATANITGYAASVEQAAIRKAAETVVGPENLIFGTINANKLKAIVAGVGDQALQGLSFETGVLLTMNQNPVINPDDRSYFASIWHNIPQSALNAAVFGVMGGAVNAAGITGQIKRLVQNEDRQNFGAVSAEIMGDNSLPAGTRASYMFNQIRDLKVQQDALLQEATIDDKYLNAFDKKITRMQSGFDRFITEKVAGGDAELAEQIRGSLKDLKPTFENGYQISEGEKAARVFGAAEGAKRLGTSLIETQEELITVYRGEFGGTIKKPPEWIAQKLKESGASDAQGRWWTQDKEIADWYAKEAGDEGRVISQQVPKSVVEESRLKNQSGDVKKFSRDIENEIFLPKDYGSANLHATKLTTTQRAVKLVGDERGNIQSIVYPAPGDLGILTEKKGKIYIDGEYQKINLDYRPAENTPTDSSFQFLQTKYTEKLKDNEQIPVTNLPLLEKANRDGTPISIEQDGFKVQLQGSEVDSLLREQKSAALQGLINLGKDKDFISRALNVPKEFIDNPETGRLSLYEMEDHTKPLYAKISYTGQGEMNKYAAEGMTRVYEKVKIAKEQLNKAAANALGEYFRSFAPGDTLSNVTTMPEVAGFVKSHDGPYGSSASKFQQDGKMEQQIVQKWAAARSDALHGAQQEILQDPKILQEFNVVVAKLRSGDSGWVKLSEDLYPGAADEFILIQRKVLAEALGEDNAIQAISKLTNNAAMDSKSIIRMSQDSPIVEYLENMQTLNASSAGKFNVLNGAKGSSRRIATDEYYAPPIDTSRQPYFVMVRTNQPLASDNPFTFVVAPNAPALEQKIAAIKQQYGDTLEVYSSQDIKAKKMIDGVYDSGDFFTKSSVDASLQSKGLLTDFIPRTDDYVFKEFDNWMWRQEHALVRQSIESIRSDEFAQLRFLADQYGELYASKFGGKQLNPADNPYLQLINTSLNVSNKGHYDTYWGSINRGVSAAWNAATEIRQKLFGQTERGEISIEDANKIADSHGWRSPYGDVARDVWNPIISDPNVLSKFVGKANLAISTIMLRMDVLNAVVNMISLPILMQAELTSIKKNLSDSTVVGKLSNLLTEQVPGTSHRIPSAASLLYDGTHAYIHNPELGIPGINQRMYEYFSSIGAIKTDPQLLRSAMDAVPMTQDVIKSKDGILAYTSNLAKRVGELGAKYTGNNLAEDFVRFQAAHAMFRVAKEAGIVEPAELASYINTYVNRVHGNYLASQRPSLFQGPIGQAIGLFQTYQFNMIQQMTRYLQQGDRSAVVAAAALQNTIFGLQGNPMFYQLNSYIGNSNRENQDIVSTVGSTIGSPSLGKADPARWLMYGLGANALQVNLYNRGDLTPRYATVVPDRLQDIPAISIPTKAIGSFLDSMNMVAKGSGVAPAILNGIAHSGFNRPMAGLAALAEGGRTTSQGTLLNAYNDIDGWLVAATLAGGRQLNEAVLVDQYNRMQAYHSADSKRISEVSEAVKLTQSGQKGILNPEQTQDFLGKYVEAGGSLSRANAWLMEQTKNSTMSVVNRMKSNYHSPFGKRMRDMMEGGEGLENLATGTTPEL